MLFRSQGKIADLIIEAYAAESGIARAEKLKADRRASLAADIVRVYTEEATGRMTQAARQAVAALGARGADTAGLTGCAGTLQQRPSVDTIAARRRIADAVIRDRYPF